VVISLLYPNLFTPKPNGKPNPNPNGNPKPKPNLNVTYIKFSYKFYIEKTKFFLILTIKKTSIINIFSQSLSIFNIFF